MATAIEVPGIITISARTSEAYAEAAQVLFLTGNAQHAHSLPDRAASLAERLVTMIPEAVSLVLDLQEDDDARERMWRDELFPGLAEALTAANIKATLAPDENTIFVSALEE